MSEFDRLVSDYRMFIDTMKADFGELSTPLESVRQQTLSFDLGIYWIGPCEMFQHGCYICNDRASERLVDLTLSGDGDAYRLARKVAAHRLSTGEPLPSRMDGLASMMLGQFIHEPSLPRGDRTAVQRLLTLILVEMGRRSTSLTLTRNRESKHSESICDAVVVGLREIGITSSYRAVEGIVVEKKPRDIEARNAFADYLSAHENASKNDPIAFLASSSHWGEWCRPLWPRGVPEEKNYFRYAVKGEGHEAVLHEMAIHGVSRNVLENLAPRPRMRSTTGLLSFDFLASSDRRNDPPSAENRRAVSLEEI